MIDATRTFRIIVRGVFAGLTPEQRDELAASAANHDVLAARFTPEGHLSYDIAARPAFTFRYSATGQEEADIADAARRCEDAARAWLDARGYGYKDLRSSAEDLSLMPQSKRQKRAAARGSA